MTSVKELKDWLNTLPEGDFIAIDEGGLTLQVIPCWPGEPEAHYEVGGFPLDEEGEPCG